VEGPAVCSHLESTSSQDEFFSLRPTSEML
jgi:hypothetical protein